MEKTNITHLRKALDLSSYEAKLYIAGLEIGSGTLSDYARATGIPRTAVYPPLQALLSKGLMSTTPIGKRIQYQSIAPEHLRRFIDEKRAALENVIDGLTSGIHSGDETLSVRYFRGVGGIQTAGELFLTEAKTTLWKTFEEPEVVLEKSGQAILATFNQKRIAKKIHVHTVIPGNQHSFWIAERLSKNAEELREVVLIAKEQYPIEASLAIAGNIALLFSMKQVPFALLIKNKPMVRTFETMHDLIWERYRN